MSRLLLVLLFAFGFSTISNASDPVQKTTQAETDKLIKECGEAFVKALLEGKTDDVIKLCTTPFLEPGGKVNNSLDNAKRQLAFKPPEGVEAKVSETIAVDQFNDWAKKNGIKELNAKQLKQYGEFLGKEGRIVILELKVKGQVKKDNEPHLLIRVKDGKAQIVGLGVTLNQ